MIQKKDVDEHSGSSACSADALQVANAHIVRLQAVVSYALSVERENTDDWMRGMCDEVNKVLAADMDHRRCVYNGERLLLRSIRQVVNPRENYDQTKRR